MNAISMSDAAMRFGGTLLNPDASFERVRQVIDDSHLPSLPPFPPAGPPEPDQQSYEESESNLYDQTVTLETKRVTGGEFKWSRPKNNIETNRHQKR